MVSFVVYIHVAIIIAIRAKPNGRYIEVAVYTSESQNSESLRLL